MPDLTQNQVSSSRPHPQPNHPASSDPGHPTLSAGKAHHLVSKFNFPDPKIDPLLKMELSHKMDKMDLSSCASSTNAELCLKLFGHLTDGPTGQQESLPSTASERFLDGYRDWLKERAQELTELPDPEQRPAIRGLLQQMEGILAGLAGGVIPELAHLNPKPTARDGQDLPVHSKVPPLLIPVTRSLIRLLERPGEGRAAGVNPEGSRDGSGEDWNTRLGVPQYRTQSDNLVAPEATCNVTSLAMVLERLGYGRPEVMTAIEQALRSRYWNETHPKQGKPSPEDLAAVALPASYFQDTLKKYLQSVNQASESRQRIRGGKGFDKNKKKAKEQLDNLADDYHDSAQMEDLIDFLRYLRGWGDRTEFIGSHSKDFMTAIAPADEDRPKMREILNDKKMEWTDLREQMKQCLADGGGVMLSFFHKGKGDGGTHIITVQQVVSKGLIVDDPYGAIRADYDRNKSEDAFAKKGAGHSRTAEFKNQIDSKLKPEQDQGEVGADWKADHAQGLDTGEALGDSHEVPDAVFEAAWNYVRLFERPSNRQKHVDADHPQDSHKGKSTKHQPPPKTDQHK